MMRADTTTGQTGSATPRRVLPWLVYPCVALILTAWLVTAIANLDSPLHLKHVSGAWIAMSHWATQGVYYTPLEFDGHFGGSRFGPLAVALQAAAHKLFDDPIVGPKLLHVFYILALIAGLWTLLGPLRLAGHTRLLLAVLPLCTWIGWTAGLTIRHDPLPAALQVWAVVLIARHAKPSTLGVVLAAVLTGLAFLSKVSALWGAAACFFWLVFLAPKRLALFIPVWWVVVGVGLLLIEHFSGGHFSENMRVCLFPDKAAGGDSALTKSAYRVALILIVEPVLWITLPLGALGAWLGRKHAPYLAWSCLFAALMSAYLMTKAGIDANHLIDLVAVATLGTGMWLSAMRDRRQAHHVPPNSEAATPHLAWSAIVAATLLIACAVSFASPDRPTGAWGKRAGQVTDAAADLAGIRPIKSAERRVRDQLEPGEHVLSFNPMVPVLLGEDPVVVDPWMLRIYFADHPEAEAAFARRIAEREFDACVFGIKVGPELDYHPQHFGELTLQTVREHYQLDDVDAYAVFRPKPVVSE